MTEGKPIANEAAGEEPVAELQPAAATFLPQQLLQPGELVILMLKPSPLYIVLAPLGTLIVIVLAGALAMQLAASEWFPFDRQDVFGLTLGLVVLRLFWQFLEWLSRVYVLTDRRVIQVAGVLRISVFETALEKIQHTNCYFSMRERLFGLGTLLFSTAGTGTIEAAWQMIARPLEVHQTVIETINRYRR